MSLNTKIATLTVSPVVDKSTAAQHVVPEHKLRCDPPHHEPGGGGINVARAIHRLGGRATAFYPAGGYAGKLFKELLDAEEIAHQSIAIRETTRVNLIVREKETGQQYRFGMPAPPLQTAEWETLLALLADLNPFPDHLVMSGSLPPGAPADFLRRLADLVGQQRGRLILDSSGETLRSALDLGVYLIKPNLRELQQLTGNDQLGEESEIIAAARKLVDDGRSAIVVVSLGRGGAVMVSKTARAWIRSPQVPIQSKVGAGDSMVAGITLSLARGQSECDAVCFGVAAGASAVMTPGSELCRREDTERLFEQVRRNHIEEFQGTAS
jgi:6-phosphofructokinase 2